MSYEQSAPQFKNSAQETELEEYPTRTRGRREEGRLAGGGSRRRLSRPQFAASNGDLAVLGAAVLKYSGERGAGSGVSGSGLWVSRRGYPYPLLYFSQASSR